MELDDLFQSEAVELLARLTTKLIDLENSPATGENPSLLLEIFRLAHTVKGAAATVGREEMVEVAHQLETAMDLVRRGAAPTRGLIDAALLSVDLLQRMLDAPQRREDVEACLKALNLATTAMSATQPKPKERRSRPRQQPKTPAPTASDPTAELQRLVETISTFRATGARREDVKSLVGEIERLLALPLWTENHRGPRILRALIRALPPRSDLEASAKILNAATLVIDFLYGDLTMGSSEDEAQAVEANLQDAMPREEPAPVSPAPSPLVENSLRVPVALLDTLTYRLEELVSIRLRVDHQVRCVEQVQESLDALFTRAQRDPALRADSTEPRRMLEHIRRDLGQEAHILGILTRSLVEDTKEVRMVPVGPMLDGFRRVTRELGVSLHKDVRLETSGDTVRIDKRQFELLKDPLTHLLRNSLDHGLEPPEERRTAGKTERSHVRISVETRESQLWIEVEDDGRGIDPEAVRREAVRRKMLEPESAARLSSREAMNLIFAPGFSTASAVTELSGRGVGLDVVRDNIARLGGRIEFYSELGKGTRFVLSVPLTVSASRGLLLSADRQVYCIPFDAIEEVVTIEAEQFGFAHGKMIIERRKQMVHFVPLTEVLSGHSRPTGRERRNAVVLAVSDGRVAIGVDEVFGQEEMVVKSLAPGTPKLAFVTGATTLSDGRLVTVLDPLALFRAATHVGGEAPVAPSRAAAAVLIVDDSVTTRSLISSVLERASFKTLMAFDGADALRLLEQEHVDLVISDIEMPALDGFNLLERIRSHPKHARLPVILMSSLDDADSRARGAAAGASAYVVKRQFDPSSLIAMATSFTGKP
jgi:two-component system, chemotaxis family, sensor kinase CheA